MERKVYRMRELHHEKKVRVILVPTAENYSDALTKALPTDLFRKHRDTIFNVAARPRKSRDTGVPEAAPVASAAATAAYVGASYSWS